MAFILAGGTPDSIMDETKAAKPGGAQPLSRKRSGWMNERPWNGCSRSTGPYMWTPQARQAWRWINAFLSTTRSLDLPAVTLTFSVGTTATIENRDSCGFQHLVQPQAWLCRICPPGLDCHRIGDAVTDQGAALEAGTFPGQALVDVRMKLVSHALPPLWNLQPEVVGLGFRSLGSAAWASHQ